MIIIATGKFLHMPKGEQYEETEEIAAILKNIGAAVYEGEEMPNAEGLTPKAESETPKEKKDPKK